MTRSLIGRDLAPALVSAGHLLPAAVALNYGLKVADPEIISLELRILKIQAP